MEIHNDTYCVYAHTNKINGKMYIGQTKQNPEKRWGTNGCGYLQKRKNGEYKHPKFANAINKYTWDGFEHEIIASNLTLEEANHLEELLIKEFDTTNKEKGYNLQNGGKNHSVTEESRKKMSEATKNRKKESYRRNVDGTKNPRAQSVAQYTTDGVLIKIWDYMTQAATALNLKMSNISRCCQHQYGYKTAGGFRWEYYMEAI